MIRFNQTTEVASWLRAQTLTVTPSPRAHKKSRPYAIPPDLGARLHTLVGWPYPWTQKTNEPPPRPGWLDGDPCSASNRPGCVASGTENTRTSRMDAGARGIDGLFGGRAMGFNSCGCDAIGRWILQIGTECVVCLGMVYFGFRSVQYASIGTWSFL